MKENNGLEKVRAAWESGEDIYDSTSALCVEARKILNAGRSKQKNVYLPKINTREMAVETAISWYGEKAWYRRGEDEQEDFIAAYQSGYKQGRKELTP